MEIEYFGTDINSKGHYLWEIWGNNIHQSRRQLYALPFNPEGLPYKLSQNGYAAFYQFAGFSIMAIAGSCSDNRPGSKSVFFIEKIITNPDLTNLIINTGYSAKIIQKMPFEVRWI